MPGSRERTCIACRGKYHYCPKCTEDANKPVWMFAFCSEECKETFTIVRDYCGKKLTKSGAKSMLSKVVKSPFDKFDSSITERLNEIFKEDFITFPITANGGYVNPCVCNHSTSE